MRLFKYWLDRTLTLLDWSVESMGEFRFGELTERVVEGQFKHFEGSEPIGFSHRDFGFVV